MPDALTFGTWFSSSLETLGIEVTDEAFLATLARKWPGKPPLAEHLVSVFGATFVNAKRARVIYEVLQDMASRQQKTIDPPPRNDEAVRAAKAKELVNRSAQHSSKTLDASSLAGQILSHAFGNARKERVAQTVAMSRGSTLIYSFPGSGFRTDARETYTELSEELGMEDVNRRLVVHIEVPPYEEMWADGKHYVDNEIARQVIYQLALLTAARSLKKKTANPLLGNVPTPDGHLRKPREHARKLAEIGHLGMDTLPVLPFLIAQLIPHFYERHELIQRTLELARQQSARDETVDEPDVSDSALAQVAISPELQSHLHERAIQDAIAEAQKICLKLITHAGLQRDLSKREPGKPTPTCSVRAELARRLDAAGLELVVIFDTTFQNARNPRAPLDPKFETFLCDCLDRIGDFQEAARHAALRNRAISAERTAELIKNGGTAAVREAKRELKIAVQSNDPHVPNSLASLLKRHGSDLYKRLRSEVHAAAAAERDVVIPDDIEEIIRRTGGEDALRQEVFDLSMQQNNRKPGAVTCLAFAENGLAKQLIFDGRKRDRDFEENPPPNPNTTREPRHNRMVRITMGADSLPQNALIESAAAVLGSRSSQQELGIFLADELRANAGLYVRGASATDNAYRLAAYIVDLVSSRAMELEGRTAST